MPITCTILRAGRTDTYGLALAVNQSYSLPDALVKDLVASSFASVPDRSVFNDAVFAGLALALDDGLTGLIKSTVYDAATALINTARLQAVLSVPGDYRITAPGTYFFGVAAGPLTIQSNSSLYIGAGVTLKVADGSPSALFTNAGARATAVAVAAGSATYGTAPDGNNYNIVCNGMTPAQLARFPVGSWLSVISLGHGALGTAGTALQMRGYRGVWKVLANDGVSQLKYETENVYPGSAPSANALQLYPADQNILITGPGTIDGNGPNASASFVDGDPRGNVIWWRHAVNITIDGPSFRRGKTWTIGSNNVRNYSVRNCTSDLRSANAVAVDFIHLSGYHKDATLQANAGDAPDNFIGITIDCTEGTAYDFPFQAPGDTYGIRILNNKANCISSLGSFGIVGVYGPEAYKHNDIEISGLNGSGSSAVQLSNYSATNQNKLCIGKLAIKNCYAQVNGASVEFTANCVVDFGDMVIEDVSGLREDVPVFRANDTCTGTIRSLALRRLGLMPYNSSTFTRTVPIARLGGPNITSLSIDGSETIATATGIFAFAADGPGNQPKVGISNCSISHPDGVTNRLWGDTGAGTAAAPVYFNARNNGTIL